MSGKQLKFLYVSANSGAALPDQVENDIKPLQAEGYDLFQVSVIGNSSAMAILQKTGGSASVKKMWGGRTKRSKKSKKSKTRRIYEDFG